MKVLDKNKLSHQLISVIINHLAICLVMLLVIFAFFAWAVGKTPAQEICSVLFMIFYIIMMYIKANETAIHDNKPYTPLKQDIKKPILWSGVIVAITYILYALYVFVWNGGSETSSGIRGLCNFIFTLWTMPYMGIIGASKGAIMWYSHIFFVAVPSFALIFGYIAGVKKFYFSDIIRKVIYIKEN